MGKYIGGGLGLIYLCFFPTILWGASDYWVIDEQGQAGVQRFFDQAKSKLPPTHDFEDIVISQDSVRTCLRAKDSNENKVCFRLLHPKQATSNSKPVGGVALEVETQTIGETMQPVWQGFVSSLPGLPRWKWTLSKKKVETIPEDTFSLTFQNYYKTVILDAMPHLWESMRADLATQDKLGQLEVFEAALATQRGQYETAVRLLTPYTQEAEDETLWEIAMRETARTHLLEGKESDAMALLDRVYQSESKIPQHAVCKTLMWTSQLLEKRKLFNQAAHVAKAGMRRYPLCTVLQKTLIGLYSKGGLCYELEALMLDTMGQSEELRRNLFVPLGACRYENGEYLAAAEMLEQAYDLDPARQKQLVPSFDDLFYQLDGDRHFEKRLKAREEKNSEDVFALWAHAVADFHSNRYRDAQLSLAKLEVIDSSMSRISGYQALSHWHMGEYEQAVNRVNHADERSMTDPFLHFAKAVIYYDSDEARAIREINYALSLSRDINSPKDRERLIEIKQKMEKGETLWGYLPYYKVFRLMMIALLLAALLIVFMAIQVKKRRLKKRKSIQQRNLDLENPFGKTEQPPSTFE